MSNEEYQNILINQISKMYRLHIESACFANTNIPKFILLDRTRNIHSYIIPCRIINNHMECSYKNGKTFSTSVINLLKIQYSQLDRPIFLLFEDQNKSLKILEGNYLREKILEDYTSAHNIEEILLKESVYLSEEIAQIKKEL